MKLLDTPAHSRRAPPMSELSENQILEYPAGMRTITATEASRNFKKLLDAVEGGESVAITRGGETIAEISPRRRKTAKDLFDALDKLDLPPLKPEEVNDLEHAIEEARRYVIDDREERMAWLDD